MWIINSHCGVQFTVSVTMTINTNSNWKSHKNNAITKCSIQACSLSNQKIGQKVDAYQYADYYDWADEKILTS